METKIRRVKNFLQAGLLLYFTLNTLNVSAERVRLFTPNVGLSNSHINQIYQDARGYIWIATENGLNKFNGYDFETFLSVPNDSTSIQGNFVTHVFEDSRGLFWVTTSIGLLQYDRTRNAFSTWDLGDLNETFKDNRVNYIMEDRSHNLWISYPGNGIVRLDAKTLSPTVFNRQNSGIDDNAINYIFEDRHGNLWFGTEANGVFVYYLQDNTVQHFYHQPGNPSSLSNNKVFAICENAAGTVWLGTVGGGINIFDASTRSFHSLKTDKATTENMVYSLLLDRDQNIWVGTDGAGIFKYDTDGNKTSYWEDAFSVCDLRSAKVHALFQDKQGNIWAALHQKGVLFIAASGNYFQNIGFNPFDVSKSIGSHCVISIIEDRQGNVWAGTDGDGLYRIQPTGNIDHFTSTNTPGVPENVITAVFEDSEGQIWIGTYMNGFFRYNTKTGKFDAPYQNTAPENGLSHSHVTAFAQDGEGNLWIGTNGMGIAVFHPKTRQLKQYLFYADNFRDQISSNWIFDVIIDRDKRIWVANSNGLDYLDEGKEKFEGFALTGANRIISNLMYALLEDYQGNIWVGSYHGLYCIDKSTGKPSLITTLDGLPDNMITGIEEDREHALWISTGKGLCRYHPETKEFMNFFADDGIQSNEFRRGSHFKGENDKMYFGGINGITTFYPSRISLENPLLDLVFTGFLVYNEPVRLGQSNILKKSLDETERIQLKYNQHSFTFQFAALEYRMPQRVNYYTQMVDFDTQWRQTSSNNRSVTYTNLGPGVYVFKVKATIDGKHILQKNMEVVILPPWWGSILARIVFVILLILLMYSVYVYFSYRFKLRRISMEKEQQKQLSESKLQFLIDISHEIRTPLTLIIGPLEKMMGMKADDIMHASLRIMYQNAMRILRMINQLMDLRALDKGSIKLKVESVDLLEFIRNIMNSFTDLAKSRKIAFNLSADGDYSSVFIDRDCLDKIIFNLLSNAFKYTSQGGSVDINVRTEETGQMVISVHDSGVGISNEQQEHIFDRFYQVRDTKRNTNMGTGIGLHLAKMMAELHHGALQVESEPEKGSTFSIRIPLNPTVYSVDEFGTGNGQRFQPSIPVFNDNRNKEKIDKNKKKGQESVLVVDDDIDILHYMESELSTKYHVYSAVNGKEGLIKALKHLPDIIVSDVIMPEMDGLDLCKLIKTNEKTCHIPVILLTAKTSIEQRIEGLEMGADSYIPKPFNIQYLMTRIGKLIQLRDTLKQKYTGEMEVAKDEFKVVTYDEKLLNRFHEKLKENLMNPDLNLDFFSKEMGISRVHLTRKLKAITNDSPGSYIRNYRLKHAAWLLVNKDMTIAEIAYAVGFSSQAYFSYIFKKHYGMTPTEYLETHEPGNITSLEKSSTK